MDPDQTAPKRAVWSGFIRDFPRPIQKWAKSSQNGVYHSQFLLHFGENFIRIWTKKCKVTDAWKCAYFMKCNQSSKYVTAVLLIFYIWLVIHFKWHSRSFRLHQIFPILSIQVWWSECFFSQIQQAPGHDLRKLGKSLFIVFASMIKMLSQVHLNMCSRQHFHDKKNDRIRVSICHPYIARVALCSTEH